MGEFEKDWTAHMSAARNALRGAIDRLSREISGYPTPISGCDAQFNHLLSERRRAVKAMAALEAEERVPTPRAP